MDDRRPSAKAAVAAADAAAVGMAVAAVASVAASTKHMATELFGRQCRAISFLFFATLNRSTRSNL